MFGTLFDLSSITLNLEEMNMMPTERGHKRLFIPLTLLPFSFRLLSINYEVLMCIVGKAGQAFLLVLSRSTTRYINAEGSGHQSAPRKCYSDTHPKADHR
jgi:hypothetical protein